MKILIAGDEDCWYIRRIRTVTHDIDSDDMVYRCDKPLGKDYTSLEEATAAAKILIASMSRKAHKYRSQGEKKHD